MTSLPQNPMTQSNSSILALDIGGRRVGVALASSIARLASPLTVIDLNKIELEPAVKQLIAEHQVELVVVGLPRGMQGQETAQTVVVRKIAADLSRALDVTLVMQDEAGTSLEAEELLKIRGKPYDKGDIDAEAAALILRDYLNQTVGQTA